MKGEVDRLDLCRQLLKETNDISLKESLGLEAKGGARLKIIHPIISVFFQLSKMLCFKPPRLLGGRLRTLQSGDTSFI